MTDDGQGALGTGSGVMAGTDPRESARIAVGECPALPFVPLLPERGRGSDLQSRGVAMLTDLPVDVSTRAWRLASAPGRALRRAADLLDRDLDAVEEAVERATGSAADAGAADAAPPVGVSGGHGSRRRIVVRVPGPWTTGARVERPGGRLVSTDRGALRDLAASLAEGTGAVARRLERGTGLRCRVVVDEALLWHVVHGAVAGPSHFDPVPAVPADRVSTALCRFASTLRELGVAEVLVRPPRPDPCGPEAVWSVLTDPLRGETAVDGLVLDSMALRATGAGGGSDPEVGSVRVRSAAAALDAAGTALSDGMILHLERPWSWAGVERPPATGSAVEAVARGVVGLLDTLGAPHADAPGRLVFAPSDDETATSSSLAVEALAGARSVAEALPRFLL